MDNINWGARGEKTRYRKRKKREKRVKNKEKKMSHTDVLLSAYYGEDEEMAGVENKWKEEEEGAEGKTEESNTTLLHYSSLTSSPSSSFSENWLFSSSHRSLGYTIWCLRCLGKGMACLLVLVVVYCMVIYLM